jgi:tetratricopeptide (TPR) repeat protein
MGLAKAVAELGGDRAAEEASGISKSVWYDAKTGRAVPDERSTWPAMREVLVRIPAARTGVRDWDELYEVVCAEVGRPHRRAPKSEAASVQQASRTFGGTAGLIPQQLPAGTGEFVAREGELAALDRALLTGDGRAVPIAVVVGSPGVGKTSLAVSWAHRAIGRFPDGVLYADLGGWGPDRLVAVEEVLPAWLRAFGMDPTVMPNDVTSRSAALRTVMAGKQVLVVLDNARSEEQVRPLLPGSMSCSVLITSRQDMPGLAIHHSARVVRLSPLTIKQSTELLRTIVGTAVEEDAEAVAALVGLCGRLPLVLRIVAEVAKSRPATALESLVAELTDERDRLDQLRSDDPRSDPRTVFSWSYNQLPSDVAATFRLFGLFPGRTFDRYIAAALAGTTPREAVGQLRSLVRAHLVQESAQDQFEMHDLIRLYTLELVHRDEGKRQIRAARLRLFYYFLHTAHRADELIVPHRYHLRPPDGTHVSKPLHTYDQALRWLDTECSTMVALCRQDESYLDPLRWRLAFQLKSYFFLTKRPHEWIDSHESALAAAVRAGDRLGEAMTRSNLGLALHERGEDDAALEHYRIAERVFAEVNDPHGVTSALAHQAVIHRRRGEFERSLELNARALDFYRRAASRSPRSHRYIAITLRSIALVEIEMHQFDDAERHLTESLEICAELAMDMDAARAWNTLGRVLLLSDRHRAADRAYRAGIEASRTCGSRFEEALARRGLGSVAAATGDHARAEQYWRRAWRILSTVGSAQADEVLADLATLPSKAPGQPIYPPD